MLLSLDNLQIGKLASTFETCVFLKNGGQSLLAIGCAEELLSDRDCWQKLDEKLSKSEGHWFGYLSYDLKNELEKLASNNPDNCCFPRIQFIRPKVLLRQIEKDQWELEYDAAYSAEKKRIHEILSISDCIDEHAGFRVNFHSRVSKGQYLENVAKIKECIRAGQVYELNYCIEYFDSDPDIEPAFLFDQLNFGNQAPFTAYFQHKDYCVISLSPERFIRRNSDEIISQPMKGTAPRFQDIVLDQASKNSLEASEKDRSENIMIVDLVRNDLSKICKSGSVRVTELCGVHSYSAVHQMISTVTGKLKDNLSNVDVLKGLFPMGSMTGAPKVRAMQIIEELECTKRGVYSGALGFIAPDGNFDFNVVIRSIVYNAQRNYLSLMVGGAITDKSDPEEEYEETQVKLRSVVNALEKCEVSG